MKIRITIMTENNRHFEGKYSKEMIERKAKDAWDLVLKMLVLKTGEDEFAKVEKCELVEK